MPATLRAGTLPPCHPTRKVFPSQDHEDHDLSQTWSYGNTVCSIDRTSFCRITKSRLGMEPFPGNTEGWTPTIKPLAVYLLPNSWNFEGFCHRAWRPVANCNALSLQLPDSQCWSCRNMTSRETGVRKKLMCQLLFPPNPCPHCISFLLFFVGFHINLKNNNFVFQFIFLW